MDEDQTQKEQDMLNNTRKRKRKGIPRKFLPCDQNFSISKSFHQSPIRYFSNEDGFDLNKIGGDFRPCSLIIRAGEDIIAKIYSFCERFDCNCYIVAATGCVARASILQCGMASTYEGYYEIVSLTGHVSMPLNLSRGKGHRVVITLAAKNDSLFGGYVSGPLIVAKTNVQIVLLKFTSPSVEEASIRDSSSTVESSVTTEM